MAVPRCIRVRTSCRSRASALAGLGCSRVAAGVPLSARGFLGLPPGGTVSAARPRLHSPMSRTQIASPLHSRELSPGLPGAFIFQLQSQLPEPRNSLRLLQSMESNFVEAQSSGHKICFCTSSRLCSYTFRRRSLLGREFVSALAPLLAFTLFGNAVIEQRRQSHFFSSFIYP